MVVARPRARPRTKAASRSSGEAARLLFRLIHEELSLSREQCFVTNVVKCRPPGNRTPSRHEIETLSRLVLAQLRDVAPRVVLALRQHRGPLGLRLRRGDRGEPTVGSPASLGPGMATYHPAAALRSGTKVLE